MLAGNFTPTKHTKPSPALDPALAPKLAPGLHVLIIGASRGIGASIAHAYAQAGASTLILAARASSSQELGAVAQTCQSACSSTVVTTEEVDITINEKDLRIDTFCSSGPGGQSVNTTYSAVRLTHIPTGVVVSQQDEKSQIKNRQKAMKVLRARLYEMELRKQQEAIARDRRSQVGTGERSEKIRTYNVPQSRVTDHRINLTLYKIDKVLSGEALDEIIDAILAEDQAARLATIDAATS